MYMHHVIFLLSVLWMICSKKVWNCSFIAPVIMLLWRLYLVFEQLLVIWSRYIVNCPKCVRLLFSFSLLLLSFVL